MLPIEFQIAVLAFIRDWYLLGSQNYTGRARHQFELQAKNIQKLIEGLIEEPSGE